MRIQKVARLQWSETEPALDVSNAQEFDKALDQLAPRFDAQRPGIVALYSNGYQLIIGIGLPHSFVQIQNWDDPGSTPTFATVGDPSATGAVDFFLLGEHHTEIPEKNLIPAGTARLIARQFLETGDRSEIVPWEQV